MRRHSFCPTLQRFVLVPAILNRYHQAQGYNLELLCRLEMIGSPTPWKYWESNVENFTILTWQKNCSKFQTGQIVDYEWSYRDNFGWWTSTVIATSWSNRFGTIRRPRRMRQVIDIFCCCVFPVKLRIAGCGEELVILNANGKFENVFFHIGLIENENFFWLNLSFFFHFHHKFCGKIFS